jgi:hypothetical protein
MSPDLLDAVLSYRCDIASTACEIIVRRDDGEIADSPFQAIAQRLEAQSKILVVNERGLPLKAFGRTPEKAAQHLVSALRRRWDRG